MSYEIVYIDENDFEERKEELWEKYAADIRDWAFKVVEEKIGKELCDKTTGSFDDIQYTGTKKLKVNVVCNEHNIEEEVIYGYDNKDMQVWEFENWVGEKCRIEISEGTYKDNLALFISEREGKEIFKRVYIIK